MKIELRLPSNNWKKNFIYRPWFLGNINPCIFLGGQLYGSKRFLECVHDNFLIQMIGEAMRKCPLLDLVLANKAEMATV